MCLKVKTVGIRCAPPCLIRQELKIQQAELRADLLVKQSESVHCLERTIAKMELVVTMKEDPIYEERVVKIAWEDVVMG